MLVSRTVGFSQTAIRPGAIGRTLDAPHAGVAGVEFAGLGCSIEEWDAVAATMPEAVRPSMRGAWSPAFERACLAFRAARAGRALDVGAQLQARESGAERPARDVEPRPGGINWALSAQILAVLGPAARPMIDILTAVPQSTPASVKMTVYRLVHVGAIKRVGPRQRDGYRYAAGRRIPGAES